jgi:hypothetical protein
VEKIPFSSTNTIETPVKMDSLDFVLIIQYISAKKGLLG